MRCAIIIYFVFFAACAKDKPYDEIKSNGYKIKRMKKNYVYGGEWTNDGVIMNLQVSENGQLAIHLICVSASWFIISPESSLHFDVDNEKIILSTQSQPFRERKSLTFEKSHSRSIHTIETATYPIAKQQLKKILYHNKRVRFVLQGKSSQITATIQDNDIVKMKKFYEEAFKRHDKK